MPLSSAQRRELLKQSHHLKAAATFSAESLGAGAVDHVRQMLIRHETVKVRINADSGEECDAAAADLAAGVPCELVGRIGRVVILHRAASDSGGESS